MQHAFSIDVEDWYQGLDRPYTDWAPYEKRVRRGMDRLLALLDRHDTRATCFILGKVAEEHPGLVRDIHAAGHEIATHGYHHEEVHKITPEHFRDDLRRSIDVLEDLTNESVIGYRAPYFTVTKASLWALDILADEGILYDSSIHPVFHYRYGIPGAAREPSFLEVEGDRTLLELPVSTYPLARKTNLPVGGGAYLRLYPLSFQRWTLERLRDRGEVIRLYTHPWEMDPDHPKIALPWKLWFTHYVNLKSTHPKFEALLQTFSFAPYGSVFADEISQVRRRNQVEGPNRVEDMHE